MNNDQMYDTLKALIEKYNVIVEKEGGQKVFWDFGVTKENDDVLMQELIPPPTYAEELTFEIFTEKMRQKVE